ncbi:DUF1700 domain-containing protein [Cohnella algarum]|uniref:DUF1700 domain-containing protein n=1 Tax=Cohnella algarum TaxID=2044859 RepID=UPI00196821FB|nr:DUF1700 domain-containing protein [Cohnella algarum]MBN2982210.1 DUF1700 domain-containing protein [Cohnella algarum]
MSPRSKVYLDQLYAHLDKLPEDERLDAVKEIESHLAESIANGQPEAVVLARLGHPRKLAKAYRSEYMMGRSAARSFREMMALIGFYCTTGLLSVMVIPVLATIAYGFGFCSVCIALAGAIRTFGVTWIQIGFGPDMQVPTEWSLAVALPIAGLVGGIAYASWKGLHKYLSFLSSRYKATLPGSQAQA